MRISELSRRSGVPASTLRYYGQLGILPAGRTAAGYRVYDEDAHQRLVFIEAAKRLRLSLPAIADLLTVWQADACRAVKQQLRPLLQERLGDTETAITELQSLRDQLVGAQTRLDELPDRDDRCDPSCAFLLRDQGPVTLLPLLGPPSESLRCSLEGQDYRDRVGAWRDLLRHAEITAAAEGFSATLNVQHAAALTALIVAEQSCCPFLHFTVAFAGTEVQLTVAGPADAQPLIAELVGMPMKEPLS